MNDTARKSALAQVNSCLTRSIAELEWLIPLRVHIDRNLSSDWSAIGFDTNSLKKLRRYPLATRSTILAYADGKGASIVIPAQAVQEYWNNHGAFVQDAHRLENATKKLASQYSSLQDSAGAKATLERLAREILDLAGEVEDSQNENLLRGSVEFWESLLPSSTVAHVPRGEFAEIGQARMASGVAPGFADERKGANGLGDFFIWADFLLGLLELDLPPCTPAESTVVFVTDDVKEDWLSSGVPHPTLLGEVYELTGRTLTILATDDLKKLAEA
jgi:hypothetical protein